MIPAEKSAAVARGLDEAFGVTEYEDIRQLTPGQASNLVFRIVVRGSPFVLRLNLRAGDVACHYACLRAAAEAGLAPRVWYTNVEDRLSIIDLVEARPFPVTEARIRIPNVLRTLHALPPFPKRAHHLNTTCTFLLNKGPALDGFIQSFQAASLISKAESEELFARFAQVSEVYPHHEHDMVSSHNDLFKPDNILFDGKRPWLVDWEAAFLNDRYADLAAFANLVVANDTEGKTFLEAYFGKPPEDYQLARFFLMQQVAHIFYAMGFLLIGSAGKPIDQNEKSPEFRDFYRRFWTGEIKLADNKTRIAFGRIHLKRLFENVREARFEASLRIVAGG